MNYQDVTVIVPALNEGGNIESIIGYLEGLYPGITITVADDGSTDGTQEKVKKIHRRNRKVKLYDRSAKKVHGLTASVVDAAKRVKTKFIVVMDADFQHPPAKVKQIVEQLRESHDVVIASRDELTKGWPLHRKIISQTANKLGKLRLMNRSFSQMDFGGGFFGVKTGFFQSIIKNRENSFVSEGYKVLFDLLKNTPRKAKVSEVKYRFGIRRAGESKLSKRVVFSYFKSLVK